MTLADEIKILDDKMKGNEAQYSVDRKAAKISELSSGEFEKYEYLTGEVLGCKPGVVTVLHPEEIWTLFSAGVFSSGIVRGH